MPSSSGSQYCTILSSVPPRRNTPGASAEASVRNLADCRSTCVTDAFRHPPPQFVHPPSGGHQSRVTPAKPLRSVWSAGAPALAVTWMMSGVDGGADGDAGDGLGLRAACEPRETDRVPPCIGQFKMINDTGARCVHRHSLVDGADGGAAAHGQGLRLHGSSGGEREGDAAARAGRAVALGRCPPSSCRCSCSSSRCRQSEWCQAQSQRDVTRGAAG